MLVYHDEEIPVESSYRVAHIYSNQVEVLILYYELQNFLCLDFICIHVVDFCGNECPNILCPLV